MWVAVAVIWAAAAIAVSGVAYIWLRALAYSPRRAPNGMPMSERRPAPKVGPKGPSGISRPVARDVCLHVHCHHRQEG